MLKYIRRLTEILQPAEVAAQFERAYSQVERMLAEGEDWKKEIPAKQVFSQFCAEAKIQPGRLKNLYINVALEKKPDTFKDIVDILESFSSIS
ncbi:hypothetical protein [Parasphingorhabdus sp.]|uniref:hypothetical protein n=1 Tax=Parasphingorhabdus sp. TaxID=2709688 RepID=UPI003A8DDB1E